MLAEHGFVRVLLSAKASARPVRVVVDSGVSLDVVIRAVGFDVLSAETQGLRTQGVVIPVRSLSWIDVAGLEIQGGLPTPGSHPSFRDFVENSRRLSHQVTFHTRAGVLTGVIGECSGDVLAVVDYTGHSRVVATAAIECPLSARRAVDNNGAG